MYSPYVRLRVRKIKFEGKSIIHITVALDLMKKKIIWLERAFKKNNILFYIIFVAEQYLRKY